MPLVKSTFRSPWWLPGGHLQTLVPVFTRSLSLLSQRVAIDLPDQDRLHADLYAAPDEANKIIILTHGLEGSSRQPYIQGMAKAAQAAGYAVLAWNLRGCGEVDNLLPKMYCSGSSEDLDAVISWAVNHGYDEIYLAGYSLGGNITLKWAGEQGVRAAQLGVKVVCVASVPVDLAHCVDTLDRWYNWIYRQRFLRDMKKRLYEKAKKFPDAFDLSVVDKVRTMRDYDNVFTGPLNGYPDAEAYYAACSAQRFLPTIAVPTLLLNARNDPFFGEPCLPAAIASEHPYFTLEVSSSGGHGGYLDNNRQRWLEQRFLQFFSQQH